MTFKGWQKTSLIEYPGKVATVLFAGGCSFRCPFCYNPGLVLEPESIPDLDAEVVLSYLAANRRLYQAVVVSGGEPTLDPGLPGFLEQAGRLEPAARAGDQWQPAGGPAPALLERGLVEYVAMDVKAPLNWEAYRARRGAGGGRARGAGARAGEHRAAARRPIEVEFRCTAVPGLHSAPDLLALAGELRGARRFVLQSFRPGPDPVAGAGLRRLYPAETLRAVAEQVRDLFTCVEVRV